MHVYKYLCTSKTYHTTTTTNTTTTNTTTTTPPSVLRIRRYQRSATLLSEPPLTPMKMSPTQAAKKSPLNPLFWKRLATIIHSNQMWGSLHDDSGIIVLHSHHNTTKIKSFHHFSLMDTYFQPTFHVHPEWQTRSHNRYLPSVDGEFALVRTLCFVIPYQAPFLPNECKCLQKVCDIKQNHLINKTNRFGENIVVVCAIMVIKAPTSHILDMAKPSWLICMQL